MNKASFNIGSYKSSDVAKADFTRLANHLLSGKKYKTFVPLELQSIVPASPIHVPPLPVNALQMHRSPAQVPLNDLFAPGGFN